MSCKRRFTAIVPSLCSKVAVLAAAMVLLGAWGGRNETYRYKLTLAVDTPVGIKRGSSVVEATFFEASVPGSGIMHRLRGEAVYVDLGPEARPLIALLTQTLHAPKNVWSRDGGPGAPLLVRLNGRPLSERVVDDIKQIASMRGRHELTPDDLPNLVTFANTDDPASVIEIDPDDLASTLGPGISWREITVESTDEPLTALIARKLPWLAQYRDRMLDGQRTRNPRNRTLANSLSSADFRFGDALK